PPFEHVVAEHSRVVLRVCRALLPPDDAQDAAAEAFLSALRAYPRLRPDSDVRAWLVTIAHRKALDVLRARARTAVPVAEVPDRGAWPHHPLPDDDLWDAVRALPHKQREAVAYRYVADLPYAEVATLMGTSEAAARRNAADGVKALRRRYPVPAAQEAAGRLARTRES
ncbi:MAG: RNA polymerase sigma factor, partial [Kineosporiaceae bacterium]